MKKYLEGSYRAMVLESWGFYLVGKRLIQSLLLRPLSKVLVNHYPIP
jgi:hypothetical protein